MIREPAQKPPNQLRPLATELTSMAISVACATRCSAVPTHAKTKQETHSNVMSFCKIAVGSAYTQCAKEPTEVPTSKIGQFLYLYLVRFILKSKWFRMRTYYF